MTPTDPQRREAVEALPEEIYYGEKKLTGGMTHHFASHAPSTISKTKYIRADITKTASELDPDELAEMLSDAYSNGEGEHRPTARYLLKALQEGGYLTPPPVESDVAGAVAWAKNEIAVRTPSKKQGVDIHFLNILITAAQSSSLVAGRMEAQPPCEFRQPYLKAVAKLEAAEKMAEALEKISAYSALSGWSCREVAATALTAYNIAKGGKL